MLRLFVLAFISVIKTLNISDGFTELKFIKNIFTTLTIVQTLATPLKFISNTLLKYLCCGIIKGKICLNKSNQTNEKHY